MAQTALLSTTKVAKVESKSQLTDTPSVIKFAIIDY